MFGPGSDSGMKRRTAATPALNDRIPCKPRNGPRLGGRGDERRFGTACGFSQTVIPAKGEAREPGSMFGLGAGQWNAKGGGGNALVPWLPFALADEWPPARGPG